MSWCCWGPHSQAMGTPGLARGDPRATQEAGRGPRDAGTRPTCAWSCRHACSCLLVTGLERSPQALKVTSLHLLTPVLWATPTSPRSRPDTSESSPCPSSNSGGTEALSQDFLHNHPHHRQPRDEGQSRGSEKGPSMQATCPHHPVSRVSWVKLGEAAGAVVKSRLLKLRAQNCPHLLTVCVVGEGGRGVGGLLKGEQKSLESQGEPSPVSDPEDPTVNLQRWGTQGRQRAWGHCSLRPHSWQPGSEVRGRRVWRAARPPPLESLPSHPHPWPNSRQSSVPERGWGVLRAEFSPRGVEVGGS